jgi:hypothetical protein
MHAASLTAVALQLTDTVHQVKRVEQGRGDRYGTIDAGPALFQALDRQRASGEVHVAGGGGPAPQTADGSARPWAKRLHTNEG